MINQCRYVMQSRNQNETWKNRIRFNLKPLPTGSRYGPQAGPLINLPWLQAIFLTTPTVLYLRSRISTTFYSIFHLYYRDTLHNGVSIASYARDRIGVSYLTSLWIWVGVSEIKSLKNDDEWTKVSVLLCAIASASFEKEKSIPMC